ncbi:MAG TPA: Gfo/Idh/MocA family oxidoreductase [Terriglobales bacterium]|jgi:predicted dehydrogenase|nr:Gfo/Idh/MocA family oxidoreductase [Terriglobales bacterium]
MATNRRDFIKTTGKAITVGAATLALGGKILGANDRVRVAVCGVRGRGNDHIHGLARLPGTEIAALCDVDESVLNQRLGDVEKLGSARPKGYGDVRKLLEDKDIDAITIAAPNHWHSLMAIWACQAGKDVYVEKPCSHNFFEGRQLVRAVKKYNRICQHGSQARSSPSTQEAIQRLRDGTIGDVYLARALCYKWRQSIGRTSVEPVPAGVNYDLWTGPAPLKPFTRNRFHYNWHWIWDTGNGEVGNQAIHEIDIARWGLGVRFPVSVSAMGGHFMFDDDQETPNVLNATFYFDGPDGKGRMMELEIRHWITNHEAEIGSGAYGASGVPAAGLSAGSTKKSGSAQSLGPKDARTNTIGNLFYGSNGYLAIEGYDAYKTWVTDQVEPGPSGRGAGDHFANFIDCVRSRRVENIHCPIEEGHLSTTLVHLANASYRLGRTLRFDPVQEQVIGDDEANRLLRGSYRAPYVVPEEI